MVQFAESVVGLREQSNVGSITVRVVLAPREVYVPFWKENLKPPHI